MELLLGTATESDLNTIHSSVIRLAKSQEEIGHGVDENILVINITRLEMSENRQALNKIIGSLSIFGCKIRQCYTSIRKMGVSNWTIYTITLTIRFYYTGNKKNSLAS